ncbi:hypothetical protein LSH36_18g11057 [Paralvinella palmiformis]|uniref:SOCS box domain-containing protein n=1 Tax=Paralvinella palmiformis TaxID=53620 RepID=A0AAD9KBW5_9ANNE|nr:hypothetical protein LSH36_18g11057 [Paralvinella palmiformis]
MAPKVEVPDLINDVIKSNDLDRLRRGLAHNSWSKKQLIDGLFASASYKRWRLLEVFIDKNTPLVRYNRKGQSLLHRIVMSCPTHPEQTYNILKKVLQKISSERQVNFENFVNKRSNMSDGLTGYTALHHAVAAKDIQCVSLLLEYGAKPNIRSGFSLRTPLMEAASKGHVEIMDLLLQHNAHVYTVDKVGQTALIYAAQCGRLNCLKKLIEAKCNVNAQNYTGNSALMQAAWNGHTDCIRVLLDAKADVYSTDFLGRSVLRYAVKSRKRDVLEMILRVTDVVPQDLSIGEAVVDLDDTVMLQTLLDRGIAVKSTTLRFSILHRAAEMGSVNCLKILLENKEKLELDLNMMNEACGVTALQRACAYGNHDVVGLILGAGADPDLPSRDGLTPLFYSMEVLQLVLTKARGLECIKALLRYGCDVNMKCAVRCRGSRLKVNMTHLAYALISCNLYVAKMLVVAGASKYEMSFSSDHQPAEIFPKELLSSPRDRDTFIRSELQNPFSLLCLSRNAIRSCLKRDIEKTINLLPLPPHIKDFLNLTEIDELIDDYNKKLENDEPVEEEFEESLSYEESEVDMECTTSDETSDEEDEGGDQLLVEEEVT